MNKKPNKTTKQTKKFKLILIAVLYPSHNEAQEGHQEGERQLRRSVGPQSPSLSVPTLPWPEVCAGISVLQEWKRKSLFSNSFAALKGCWYQDPAQNLRHIPPSRRQHFINLESMSSLSNSIPKFLELKSRGISPGSQNLWSKRAKLLPIPL